MQASAALSTTAPSDLAWRVIGLVNLYRLLVPLVLLAVQYLGGQQLSPIATRPQMLLTVSVAYFFVGVLMVVARRLSWPSVRRVALLNASVDALAIALVLYACGGVASGLGILLVLPVGATSVLGDSRDAFLIASIAAMAVLAQQIFSTLSGDATSADYTNAGVIGVVLFAVALLVSPIALRLRESEALVRRQEIDLANLAQLSQYVVQHLRESILVVDTADRIRLINESAAQMLGDKSAYPGALLGEASPRLLYLLETWRQGSGSPADPRESFVAADGGRMVRPHFAPLGGVNPAPVLIFLEDPTLLEEKVQQSKLAALGRLSASIAHEIRNPVGAMSHAAQLLGESETLDAADRRLTDIIRGNAERVSGIINNILQLSRREMPRLERISLGAWVEEFRTEYCETTQWSPERMQITTPSADIEVRVDPTQLHQVVWNLCDNAIRHACSGEAGSAIEIRIGRLTPGARPYLEVADRGPGVAPDEVERIFEPFFTRGRAGTGLGLFLARELAQTNGATLLYEARAGGGSIFRLVFADPTRWELG
ncbi:MAG TPA: ATP-binding protein [Steroidobacteraceae bacterium]|nr:ATP-binding protein [Steroidobacteraceae bacterium]